MLSIKYPRASVDVDLSMDGEFDDVESAREKIRHALETTFATHGLRVFDLILRDVPPKISEEMKDFWGGYKIEFKIIDVEKYNLLKGDVEQLRRNAEVVGKKGSTKFTVDISRHEFCDEKEKYDVDNFSIFGYSPAMFVAEKARAICQQMKEYVDLVHLNPRPRKGLRRHLHCGGTLWRRIR